MLEELQRWYASQCDGEWEHAYGVTIESLDNPGWRLTIDLTGTPLEHKPFNELSDLDPQQDWIRCWVEEKRFQAACGPMMLSTVFSYFVQWASE